eukprot:TRINITY_DN75458_c0_g1_i1.p1 TRINITY_DN75458_c0_g1~~TRINITY_DN75458_c0_g1_i1.p1  ORF type:complete len:302 (-),score=56.37 TRINITY_DN75458_c0_g1_i1:231-1136(-)
MKLPAAAALLATAAADPSMRLTIANACDKPMWIAHIVTGQVGPDPQDVKINPGGSAQFHTANGGAPLSATRFWPKLGCDESGSNCTIGDSGGPSEGCVIRAPGKPDDYSHCAPPVDTKFEATFAPANTPVNDVVDMSLVDGYTLPFKLETSGGTCTRAQQPFQEMDCSGLSFDGCPASETLNGKTVSLHAVNPKTGKQAGCFSPCMKMTDDKWNANPVAPDSAEAGPYCCAGGFASPQACSAGPIQKTAYLAEARKACPAAYGYAYDDKVATIACSTTTQYKVTFYCGAAEELPAAAQMMV